MCLDYGQNTTIIVLSHIKVANTTHGTKAVYPEYLASSLTLLRLLWPLEYITSCRALLLDFLCLISLLHPVIDNRNALYQVIYHQSGRMMWLLRGDGNSLFNYVSICLTGDESKAEVLRKATAIEIYIHADQYMNHPKVAQRCTRPQYVSNSALSNLTFELDHLGAFQRKSHANFDNKGVDGHSL